MVIAGMYADAVDSSDESQPIEMLPGPDNDPLLKRKGSGPKMPKLPRNVLIGIAALAVVIIAVAAIAVGYRPAQTTTTITATTISNVSTTVTTQLSSYQIYACTEIVQPGIYTITQDISTSNIAAPCISILSKGVILKGNGHSITGNGPFVNTSTPSYGIFVRDVSGVSVEGIKVSRFSYGVYLQRVSNSTFLNLKSVNSTISDIYLNGSSGIILSNDTMYSSESNGGGLVISGGGNNTVNDSGIMYNTYYGASLNSSGNRFYGDSFSNNPTDLLCGSNANNRNSNRFENSTCQVNQYCNFAYCRTKNTPYDIANTQLKENVVGCGSIDNSGIYMMGGNLSLTDYVNMSNPLSSRSACITINSPDVRLDCQNNTIYNAHYGVVVSGLYNTSVVNCGFRNDTYGLYDNGTIGTIISNVKSSNSTYGVYLSSTTGTLINNVTGTGDVYGLYMNASSGANLYGLNMHNNSYGVYVNGQEGNDYYGASLLNNTVGDLYCSANSYNSTQNLVRPLRCGSTDCVWADSYCPTAVSLPLAVTPVYSCGVISTPGTYQLKEGILSNTRKPCMTINASEVNFDCADNFIEGSGGGTAVYASNVANVSISNCRINSFDYAFNISNSRYVKITDSNASSVKYGIYESNSLYGNITNNNVSVFSGSGFVFNSTNNSVVESNNAKEGAVGAVSFDFARSFYNIISRNNAQNNGAYAFFMTRSLNNTFVNNSETGNGPAGYYCDAYSSGLYAQQNEVNYGNGKSGCRWMIELNPQVSQTCSALLSSSTVTLSQDMLFTYGSVCYSVINQNGQTANNTLINCNGHTVLATNGGTFVNISKTSGTQVENCYLKGFTTGISGNGVDTIVLNNTIANTKTGVRLSGSNYGVIKNNHITNSSYGIVMDNARYGSVMNNTITNVNISMQLNGLFSENVNNNTARFGNIGIYLFNATENLFAHNILTNQSNAGIICDNVSGSSANSINGDYGFNICSRNIACNWMTASPLCRT